MFYPSRMMGARLLKSSVSLVALLLASSIKPALPDILSSGDISLTGDIRSRLIRLIPSAEKGSAENAIKTLLSHRFPGSSSEEDARAQWRDIVEGRSSLWRGIPPDRKVFTADQVSRFDFIKYLFNRKLSEV
jgi:hypothetical protein